MIAEFGEKLVRFVAGQKRNRVPGKITSPFTWQLPFQPVIYADSQYAIFHDMSGFKVNTYMVFYANAILQERSMHNNSR